MSLKIDSIKIGLDTTNIIYNLYGTKVYITVSSSNLKNFFQGKELNSVKSLERLILCCDYCYPERIKQDKPVSEMNKQEKIEFARYVASKIQQSIDL